MLVTASAEICRLQRRQMLVLAVAAGLHVPKVRPLLDALRTSALQPL